MLHYIPRNGKQALARPREVIRRKECFACDQVRPCTQHRGAWLCSEHAPAKPMDKTG